MRTRRSCNSLPTKHIVLTLMKPVNDRLWGSLTNARHLRLRSNATQLSAQTRVLGFRICVPGSVHFSFAHRLYSCATVFFFFVVPLCISANTL